MFLKYLHRKLTSKMSGTQANVSRIPARPSTSNVNLFEPLRPAVGTGDPPGSPSVVEDSATALAPLSSSRSSEGSGGDGWTELANGSQASRVILNCTGTEMETHLDKILECPVCFEVILPPILSCVEGHCWCESCHTALQRCPVCRGEILGMRNLLIEQFLEKCRFKCKFHGLGCPVVLPAKDLAVHCRRECPFRPIHCSECNLLVPFDEYLDHLKSQDKIQQHNASECSTGFEIDDNDFYDPPSNGGRRSAVWEPTWLNCYGENFLTFLEYNGSVWWIWVASLTELGCTYRCQTTLWNKEIRSEITFKGRIHPIRSNAFDVLSSGECLVLTASTLRKFVYRRGIDVLVRIEREYDPPRTRRGSEVQSPLIAIRGSATAAISHNRSSTAQPQQTPASRGTPVASNEPRNLVQESQHSTRTQGSTVVSNTPVNDSRPHTSHDRRDRRSNRSTPRSPTRSHQNRRMLFTIDSSPRNTRRTLAPSGPFSQRLSSVMSSLMGQPTHVADEDSLELAEMDMEDEGIDTLPESQGLVD